MNDILDKSLWSFDKRLVLLKRFNGDVSLDKVSFQRFSFWIWVSNIPIKSMNSTVGNYIANEIGIPILVDAPKSGLAWGPFLRIRVDIDITKPLMRGKMIHIEGMEKGVCISNMRGSLFIVIGVELWDIKSVSVNMPRKGVFLQRRMTINLVLGFVLWVLRPIEGKTFTISPNLEKPRVKNLKNLMGMTVIRSLFHFPVGCKAHHRPESSPQKWRAVRWMKLQDSQLARC